MYKKIKCFGQNMQRIRFIILNVAALAAMSVVLPQVKKPHPKKPQRPAIIARPAATQPVAYPVSAHPQRPTIIARPAATQPAAHPVSAQPQRERQEQQVATAAPVVETTATGVTASPGAPSAEATGPVYSMSDITKKILDSMLAKPRPSQYWRNTAQYYISRLAKVNPGAAAEYQKKYDAMNTVSQEGAQ